MASPSTTITALWSPAACMLYSLLTVKATADLDYFGNMQKLTKIASEFFVAFSKYPKSVILVNMHRF